MFNKAEQNYPIYDRELLAIVRGLRNWRHLMRNTTHPVTAKVEVPRESATQVTSVIEISVSEDCGVVS